MAFIDKFRAEFPQYKDIPDDQLMVHAHGKYFSDMSFGDFAKKVNYEDPNAPGDISRGASNAVNQWPMLAYGVEAAAGDAIEDKTGYSGIKDNALEGYRKYEAKVAENTKPTDSLTYSLDKATNEGDYGALVDWAQYAIGYGGVQGMEMLATAGIGSAAAKQGAKVVAKEFTDKLITKQVAEIAGSKAALTMTNDEIMSLAVKNAGQKLGNIGATSAMGASSLGMESGDIGGDMVNQADKEGRNLTDDERARGFGWAMAAGGIDLVGDKFGLDVLTGKSRLFKAGAGMEGVQGKVARGLLAGSVAAPVEGIQENIQTRFEQYGKGQDVDSQQAKDERFDAAGMGVAGGGMMAAGGGMLSKARNVDEAIEGFNQSVSNPPTWETPTFKNNPDANKIVQNRSVPGSDLKDFIDTRTDSTGGYVPAEQPWEAENLTKIQSQADKNKAFYEAEQQSIAEKIAQLNDMENNKDASPSEVKQYRKKRIELETQRRQKVDEFRAGLGFDVIPAQSGAVKNTQLADQLKAVRPTTESKIKQGLIDRGIPEHVADGFIANFQDESGLDSGINEKNPTILGSRGGFGLAQWTGPRRKQLEAFANDKGLPVSDINTQLDFVLNELANGESGAAKKIMNSKNAGDAAANIATLYLRPAEKLLKQRVAKYLNQNFTNTGAEKGLNATEQTTDSAARPNYDIRNDANGALSIPTDRSTGEPSDTTANSNIILESGNADDEIKQQDELKPTELNPTESEQQYRQVLEQSKNEATSEPLTQADEEISLNPSTSQVKEFTPVKDDSDPFVKVKTKGGDEYFVRREDFESNKKVMTKYSVKTTEAKKPRRLPITLNRNDLITDATNELQKENATKATEEVNSLNDDYTKGDYGNLSNEQLKKLTIDLNEKEKKIIEKRNNEGLDYKNYDLDRQEIANEKSKIYTAYKANAETPTSEAKPVLPDTGNDQPGIKAAVGTGAVESDVSSEVTENDLIDHGLIRQDSQGRWKYKYAHDSNFFTANSKESAIEEATKAFNKWPKELRKTKEQANAEADASNIAKIDARYGSLPEVELQSKLSKLEADKVKFQNAGKREFNGNGGRRTSAAVSAEAARETAQEIRDIESHLERRAVNQQSSNGQAKQPHEMNLDEFKKANPDIRERSAKSKWAGEVADAWNAGKDVPKESLDYIKENLPGFVPDGLASDEELLDRLKSRIDNHLESELLRKQEEHKKELTVFKRKETQDRKKGINFRESHDTHGGKLRELTQEIESLKEEIFKRGNGNTAGENAKRVVKAYRDSINAKRLTENEKYSITKKVLSDFKSKIKRNSIQTSNGLVDGITLGNAELALYKEKDDTIKAKFENKIISELLDKIKEIASDDVKRIKDDGTFGQVINTVNWQGLNSILDSMESETEQQPVSKTPESIQEPDNVDRKAENVYTSKINPAEQDADVSAEKLHKELIDNGVEPDKASEIVSKYRNRRLSERQTDSVTGFNLASDQKPTIERVIKHVENTGDTAHYVEGDIINLGGINNYFNNHAEPANKVMRGMSDIFEQELRKAGTDAVFFRQGGDEISATVIGGTKDSIEAAIDSAKQKVSDYIKSEGLHEIPHGKGKKNIVGSGLHVGYSEILPGKTFSEITKEASIELDNSKNGVKNVNRKQNEAAGLGESNGTGTEGGSGEVLSGSQSEGQDSETGVTGAVEQEENKGIKFSRAAAESTLAIIHNLSLDNLIHSDKMGGIAVPSVAVVDKNKPMAGFGDITLLANKDTLGPQAGKENRYFNADIYSPRYPSVSYDVDYKKFNNIIQGLTESAKAIAKADRFPSMDDVERSGVVKGFQNNLAMQYQYLESIGKAPKLKFLKKISIPANLKKYVDGSQSRYTLMDDQRFIDTVAKNFADSYKRAGIAEEMDDRTKRNLASDFIYKIESAREEKISPRIDRSELSKSVQKVLPKQAFDKWLRDSYSGIVNKEQIFDGYTNSGNRKYLPHNLETVVKTLNRSLKGGEGYNYGVPNIRAQAAKQFKTIKSLQDSRNDLVSDDEMEALKKEVGAEYDALENELEPYKKFERSEAAEALAGLASKGYREFNEYYKDVPAEIMQQAADFLNKLKHMPSHYFEGKIGRAVDIGEFEGAIVPAGKEFDKAVEILKNNGVKNIKRYKKGDDESRVKALHAFEDLFFSQSTTKPENTHTTESLTDAIKSQLDKKFGTGWTDRLFATGKFKVIDAEEAAGIVGDDAKTAKAFYNESDKVSYIVADNISDSDSLAGILLHEISVHALTLGKTDAEFKSILSKFEQLKKFNPKVKAAFDRVPEGTNPDHVTEEGLAYFIESYPDSPLANKVIEWLRQAIRKIGSSLGVSDKLKFMKWANALTETELLNMATSALKSAPEKLNLSENPNNSPSSNFDKWFKGSKIVNKDGKPLVMYHGTTADFESFDTSKQAHHAKGSFFSSKPETAEFYAGLSKNLTGGNEQVMPVYLNIKNPLIVNKLGEPSEEYEKKIKGGMLHRMLSDKPKHDGIIVKNEFTGEIVTAIARNPNQIKSAIGNTGTFNSDSDNIKYSVGKAIDRIANFKKWFGDSKVVDDQGNPLVVYHGTNANIDMFSMDKAGSATEGVDIAKEGMFFTNSHDVAQDYTGIEKSQHDIIQEEINKLDNSMWDDGVTDKQREKIEKQIDALHDKLLTASKTRSKKEGGNVMPVFLSIKNPLIHDFKGQGTSGRSFEHTTKYLGLIEKAKQAGNDGVIFKNTFDSESEATPHDVYIAFNPNQIKSAIGNNGEFSQSNDNIKFSRTNPNETIDSINDIPRTTISELTNKFKYTGDSARIKGINLGLSALTQRQLVEIGSKIMPNLKQFDVIRNLYDTTEATWHKRADEIANRWEKIAPNFKRLDNVWKMRNQRQQKLLADLMHEMTISGLDPRIEQIEPTGDNESSIIKHGELQALYNQLNANAKQLLDDVEKFHNDVTQSLIQNITDKITGSDIPSESKHELISDIKKKFKQVDGPYFPLMRFGKYWVDYNGGVQFFETKKEQSDFITQSKQDGLNISGFGKSLDNFNEVQGVDAGFVDNVNTLIDKMDIDQANQLKDGIFQLYLTALPEQSMRKRMIHRKKTPGYEQDALRSFAKKAFHDGKQLAKLKYAPELKKVLTDSEEIMKIGNSSKQLKMLKDRINLLPELITRLTNGDTLDELKDDYEEDLEALKVINKFARHPDGEREQAMVEYLEKQEGLLDLVNEYKSSGDESELSADVINALNKSYQNMMESNTSPVTNLINQSVFTFFLGFNPASALVNMLQNGVSLGVVAGRHGFIPASKALAKATHDFFSNRTTEGFGIKPALADAGERKMYEALTNNGTFDRTRSHDLAGISEEGVNRGTLHRDFMLASTYMFHHAEVANREISALMAYRMEFAKHGNVDKAIQYANDIINSTHLDYSSNNRPDLFQGNAARVMLQFKMYSQGMTYLWGKTAWDALKSTDPERKAEARNIILSMVGVQTAMAGVLGLPIGGLMLAAQMLAGMIDDDDDPVDIELEIRHALNNVFGADIGRILARGALSETGADLHGRISLSDLWIREPDRELEGKDQAYYLLKTVIGPMGGIIENAAVGMQLINDGNTERGIEKLLPNSISGAAKALRMLSDGGATSLTGNMIYETNMYEKSLQAIGFRPSGLAEQQLQNSAIKNRESAITKTKSKLLHAAVNARIKRDADAISEAQQEIRNFNAKYPEIKISTKDILKSVRTRKTNAENSENGIVTKPKLKGSLNSEKFID